MHVVGYFEGIDPEPGNEWRCSDPPSPRDFLLLEATVRVSGHSWLSKTRRRLSHEVREQVFGRVLALIGEHERRGASGSGDSSTKGAKAASHRASRYRRHFQANLHAASSRFILFF
jgi:hypothetical protein